MNILELLDGPIPPPELVAIGPITAAEPVPENGLPPEVIGRRLAESEILELWEERACIIHEANTELVQWCQDQGFPPEKTWRYCQLCAAADLSLSRGTYVEAAIYPRITIKTN